MPQFNITKAAELVGMTRQNLHKYYITKGLLSVDRSNPKKPVIEMSELLRVFPKLQNDVKNDVTGSHIATDKIDAVVATLNEKIKTLEGEVAVRDQLLQERAQRIEDLKVTIALITDKSAPQTLPPQEPPKRRKFLGLF